jgi:hypothetical protein
MRARLVVAVACVALLGAACSSTLDTDGLEDQIRSLLEDRGGQTVTTVDCPADIEAEAGTTFECSATGEDVEWVVRVTQTDDQGNVEIEIVGAE